MPLLDHFQPPIHPKFHWESFHSNWATRLADMLNEHWLPPDFLAEEYTYGGARFEIDVATFGEPAGEPPRGSEPAATLTRPVWTPPAAPLVMPTIIPDSFEVRVFSDVGGRTLVAAIELVSPGNKDRAETRRAFATKCASLLYQDISLIIMDIVTARRGNLHNDTMRLMEAAESMFMSDECDLYAVAYRPVSQQDHAAVEVWPHPCALGAALPTMPLRLTGDLFVPVNFEASYQEACKRRRLA